MNFEVGQIFNLARNRNSAEALPDVRSASCRRLQLITDL